MATYDVKLLGRREVARGTTQFRFTWPEGFEFKPGQAIELLLGDPAGGHAFSLVNAPFEHEIVVTTRMRDSAYKRVLRSLADGADVKVDGPFGSLTLHRNPARGAVFIAGGIGITPFMSILRQSAREGMPHRITLIYSNRTREDAAFIEELEAIARAHANFRLVTTMTETGGSLVDASMVSAASSGLPSPIFYVAGPPAMVEAMKAVLDQAGIEDTDVRTEEFFGYETAVVAATSSSSTVAFLGS